MNRLIAITIVRNEKDNYLTDWLRNISKYTDYLYF